MFLNNNALVVAYGVGGHKEQMNRLMKEVLSSMPNKKIIAFTDDKTPPEWVDEVVNIDEVRSKINKYKFFNIFSLINIIKSFYEIKRKYSKVSVLSTGPGHAILISFFVKIHGGKVVHVETWSRFYSKSLTGKVMYYLADKFYVQNEELLNLYPKGIFSGRL